MSDLAITYPDNTTRTAFEFRELFLDDGLRYEKFYCPFCHANLIGRLIYTEGELSKSPHFALGKGSKHYFDCDGRPINTENTKLTPAKSHYIKSDITYPEVFIKRPEKRQTSSGIFKPSEKLTLEQVARNRKSHSVAGTARAKTYLLQSIVEFRNTQYAEVYATEKERRLDKNQTNELIKNTLNKYALKLDDETNYLEGICNTKYIKQKKRIYYGNGEVTQIGSDITLSCKDIQTELNNKKYEFLVQIKLDCFDLSCAPQIHKNLVLKLTDAKNKKLKFRWYAYGLPKQKNDQYILEVESLDDLYIKAKKL